MAAIETLMENTFLNNDSIVILKAMKETVDHDVLLLQKKDHKINQVHFWPTYLSPTLLIIRIGAPLLDWDVSTRIGKTCNIWWKTSVCTSSYNWKLIIIRLHVKRVWVSSYFTTFWFLCFKDTCHKRKRNMFWKSLLVWKCCQKESCWLEFWIHGWSWTCSSTYLKIYSKYHQYPHST